MGMKTPDVVNKLVQAEYLRKHPGKRDHYELGPRTFVDLNTYVSDILEDIGHEECAVCSDPVLFTRKKCPYCKSNKKMHTWCWNSWIKSCEDQGSGEVSCPDCTRNVRGQLLVALARGVVGHRTAWYMGHVAD